MTAALDRRRLVVVALVLGGIALAATAAPWVRATTATALQAEVQVTVPGSEAAAASAAGALVVVAAALAMALGGRWGARAAAAGVVLGGVLVAVSAGAVLADPAGAAETGAQQAVGVGALTGPATTTPAVAVALGSGVLAAVVGLLASAVAARWTGGARRHDRPTAAAAPAPGVPGVSPADDQDAWDALSRGEDPT
ncbi:MAG: Trp biosynthesis-associated membrane protein [Actinotalea sp.]|nr:Trp biosynthesis-associated membrane protein [Actinotalea sp.]